MLKLPIKPRSVAGPISCVNCCLLVRLEWQIVCPDGQIYMLFVSLKIWPSRLHIRRFVRLRRFVGPDDLLVLYCHEKMANETNITGKHLISRLIDCNLIITLKLDVKSK